MTATILISAVIAGYVFLVIRKMVKDRKSNHSCSSCGCGCSACSLAEQQPHDS